MLLAAAAAPRGGPNPGKPRSSDSALAGPEAAGEASWAARERARGEMATAGLEKKDTGLASDRGARGNRRG
jgi:hypothetical protein